MDLSAADADKWVSLLGRGSWTLAERSEASDYEPGRQIRQHQTRLDTEQIDQLVSRYLEGATVYELAAEFGCHRATVSDHVKRSGVPMRRHKASAEQIDEIVRLYESGLSLARVGDRVGMTARSVLKYLRGVGIATRDSHGRERQP